MKFFKQIFKKQEDELSPEEIDQLNDHFDEDEDFQNSQDEDYQQEEKTPKMSLESFVNSLELNQLNKVRNLIDLREEQLTPNSETKKKETSNTIEIQEEIEEVPVKLKEEQEENFQVEVEDSKEEEHYLKKKDNYAQDDEEIYEEMDTDEYLSREEEETSNTVEIQEEDYVSLDDNNIKVAFHNQFSQKLQTLFGEENIFTKEETSSSLDIIKSKPAFYIGIRNKDYFGKEQYSEESAWFISTIKQVEELKNFKMISSNEYQKELIWNDSSLDSPIVIFFKTTQGLMEEGDFPFP